MGNLFNRNRPGGFNPPAHRRRLTPANRIYWARRHQRLDQPPYSGCPKFSSRAAKLSSPSATERSVGVRPLAKCTGAALQSSCFSRLGASSCQRRTAVMAEPLTIGTFLAASGAVHRSGKPPAAIFAEIRCRTVVGVPACSAGPLPPDSFRVQHGPVISIHCFFTVIWRCYRTISRGEVVRTSVTL